MKISSLRRGLLLGWLACISCLLTACDLGNGDGAASLGTLERDRIELTFESNEPIAQILVREGQHVIAGDVLLIQDSARAEVALARAQAERSAAESALQEAEAGPRAQQIQQARERLRAANSAKSTALHELRREQALVQRKLSSQSKLDILKGRYDENRARANEARAALEQLQEGTRSEVVDAARSRHAAAEAEVNNLEISLARTNLLAPVSGIIEALPFEIGERPTPGATVAVLLASGRVYAKIHVSEPLRAQLAENAVAEIHMDGQDEPLPGKLRWIAADAAFTPYFALNQHDRARLSYLAEVDVDDEYIRKQRQPLPTGIPVQVIFPDLAE